MGDMDYKGNTAALWVLMPKHGPLFLIGLSERPIILALRNDTVFDIRNVKMFGCSTLP